MTDTAPKQRIPLEQKEEITLNFKEMSYRRVQNLGNYSTETVELTVTVDSEQDVDEVFESLRKKVKTLIGIQ